jgi:hypothetical protein
MSFFKIFVDPGYQMVLENSFNKLMKEVWSDEFVYVGSREIISEWLVLKSKKKNASKYLYTHHHIANNTIVFI